MVLVVHLNPGLAGVGRAEDALHAGDLAAEKQRRESSLLFCLAEPDCIACFDCIHLRDRGLGSRIQVPQAVSAADPQVIRKTRCGE